MDNIVYLAATIHFGDRYGEHDYMYHLRSVFQVAFDLYGSKWAFDNADLLYLHDAIEDHPDCLEKVWEQIGYTKTKQLQDLNKNNFNTREEYLDHIKVFGGNALKVKICDTISNLQESVKIGDMKRVKRYAWQLNYLLED